jgi:hypothetical protein
VDAAEILSAEYTDALLGFAVSVAACVQINTFFLKEELITVCVKAVITATATLASQNGLKNIQFQNTYQNIWDHLTVIFKSHP